jgi:hypothetical protein
MAAFVLSLVLAMVLGFAAHRAGVCSVRAVAEVMHARTLYIFKSIGKSALWILIVTIPFFWLMPSTMSGLAGWELTVAAVTGGLLFGLGAGINGACSYSTMTRLVDGEVGMLIAVISFAFGVFVFTVLIDLGWTGRPQIVPPLVGSLVGWGAILSVVLIAYGLFEAIRLLRTREPGSSILGLALAHRYRLSTSALLMGAMGGAIFLLYGSAGYSSTFEVVIEGALGTRPWPSRQRWLLLLAVLVGMFLSTLQRGSFKADWRPRRMWWRNVFGGALMGLGVALAPGGNDALVLYGVPNLSPHALPAYAAMAIGIAAGLLLLRMVFGIEARVACKDDVYYSDTGLGRRPLPSDR